MNTDRKRAVRLIIRVYSVSKVLGEEKRSLLEYFSSLTQQELITEEEVAYAMSLYADSRWLLGLDT